MKKGRRKMKKYLSKIACIIMTGITEEEFNPQGQYTVEQAVATIVRLYNLLS